MLCLHIETILRRKYYVRVSRFMMKNEPPPPSEQQIVVALVASVLLISTTAFSQYALASSYDGQDVLRTPFNEQETDLEVEEVKEIDDIMMTNQTANENTTTANSTS